MRYGIISDIHSNLESALAVIEELTRRGIKRIICLGDIVGYGANPNECCNLIRTLSEYIVMGNHDAGSIELTRLSDFNRPAIRACVWTSKVLSRENREWLRGLPFILNQVQDNNERKVLVHSSPSNPRGWNYIITLGNAVMEFEGVDFEICFVGHSHCPVIFMEHNGEYSIPDFIGTRLTLMAGARYIINPGSVGQPRDSDSRASFAIYDADKKEIEIVRVSYDITGAQQKILDARLPDFLAYRLAVGK